MRYALISDIHGNLEALKAVLDALSAEKIDRYFCVGDIVGYGADPAECIRAVRSLNPAALVAGNHEWGVTGLLGLDYFNDYARVAIEWTKSVLKKDELDYLKTLQLVAGDDDFQLVHGGLTEPSGFPYIVDSKDARSTIALMNKRLCFVGHTHVAEIYYSDKDAVKKIEGSKVKLQDGGKYLINVGSVGQPRDMNTGASYVIFDSSSDTVEIKRASYDIKAAQTKILAAGLPPTLASRLSEGR